MRRLILILLLVVYPFQVALAMADKCCAMTPAGVSHHSVAAPGEGGPVFVADDGAAVVDPHCAACTFGHTACLPAPFVVIPAERRHASSIAFFPPYLKAPPARRPERPQWSAAA